MININKLEPMANNWINNNINKYKSWLLYIYDNCVKSIKLNCFEW